MITIITVNWNAYDFLYLMIESLQRFSTLPYDLIVIDNSINKLKVTEHKVHQFFMPNNIGHGRGLNNGCEKAYNLFPKNPFLLFLDIDSHIVSHDWEMRFINKMNDFDLIGARGSQHKPIRPACMFFKKELIKYDWNDTSGYRGNRVTPEGFDVAIKAHHKIIADGFRVGYMDCIKNKYDTVNGELYCLDNKPIAYHHWSATWLDVRQDDFPDVDLQKDKEKLFQNIPWRLP